MRGNDRLQLSQEKVCFGVSDRRPLNWHLYWFKFLALKVVEQTTTPDDRLDRICRQAELAQLTPVY